MSGHARHTLGDSLWRMLQGSRLSANERTLMGRTLRVLEGQDEAARLEGGSERMAVLPGDTLVRQGDEGQDLQVPLEALDAQRPLAHGVHALADVDVLADPGRPTHAVDTGGRQDHGRVLFALLVVQFS